MKLNSVHTIDLILNLIPNLTLLALHRDEGVRLIAQHKFASFIVINSRTDEPLLIEHDDFERYMQLLGVEQIKVLFAKQSNSHKNLKLRGSK